MITNMPLVSVVMLNFNGFNYLKETITNILKLKYKNIEFIIIDNGSNDESVKFIKKYKNIKIICNNYNLGYSIGKNIGLKEAKGSYILSIDNDILIKDNDIIEILIKNYDNKTGFLQIPIIDRGKENTHYYGTYYSIYGLNMHRKALNIKKILNNSKIEICGPTGGFFFISKNHLQKIGLFDESQKFHIDDVDIGPRSCIFGFKNYLITDIYCEHLGINKTINIESFINRYKLVFSGQARAIIKNYNINNLFIKFPIFFIYQFIKAIKYSVIKKSIEVFRAYIWSIIFFKKNLNDTIKQRKIIQSKRIYKKDVFFKIKAPKFN